LPEFQNPNLQAQGGGPGGGGGGGEMRSMLALASLFIAIFFGYQLFFNKPKPEAPQQQQTQQSTQQAATNSTASTAPAVATPAITASAESLTTIENANYKIVFSNRGALVKHWILKHYDDSAGKPLDMVQQQASARFGLPLSLFTYESALTNQLNSALYQASGTGTLTAPATLTFHYAQNGLDVVKTFTFDASYVVHATVEVTRNGQPVRALLSWPAGLGDMEEFQGHSSSIPGISRTPSFFAWSLNGKDDTQSASKVSNNNTLEGNYGYAATSDLYFTAAFLPDTPARATVVTLHNAVDLPTDLSNPSSQKRPADIIGLAVGDTSGITSVRLYAGPKQTDILASIRAMGPDGKPTGSSLKPLIQYGMWTIIAVPLFWCLRFLNEHGISNWGWDIILFTSLVYLLMLPTRISMMKSSLKQMRIQPKVEAIKRKYANLKATDPKRAEMNTEMMALYKAEGVNMYGSCIPLLVQMPLFFAYYRVLQYAVELRHAPWVWLHDLSAPDPTYILPILIIGTMFFTQIMTPMPGMDPAQRRMMAFVMPVFFGFILLKESSGLALYWCVGNIINLCIQLWINNSKIGKEMQALAAKRAAKKAGGRTLQARR
jgi:YidC/Oxa1 family membrane protein insertase